jgi:catechol 2,3-dioxygenase-like lactoylglutathione lyase family enzyme
MADFQVQRVGTILAVADVDRSIAFYTGLLGFSVEATYADPAYATLTRNGVRLSLAEQGHAAVDLPGTLMTAIEDRAKMPVVIVLEVADAWAVHRALAADGATFLADPYEPPWGGCRFFVVDPDGYLVELEQAA